MDFKKLLIITGISVVVIISTYFATKVDKPDREYIKADIKSNVMAEDDAEVEIKKDIKVQSTQPAVAVKQDVFQNETRKDIEVKEDVEVKNTQSTVAAQELSQKEKVKTVEKITSHAEAVKYIENHSLKNISNPTNIKTTGDAPRFSVFSNITLKDAQNSKNQFTPPPAPAIVSGVFPSGEPFTVVIDGDVKAVAKEIVVSNNQADGVITEMAQVSTTVDEKSQDENQYNAIIAPPSIGQ